MNPKMIPGMAVNEGLDFVKRVWGSLPLPSVITPTTDVEELDKRINDLRAVEQWLNVNLSMLRATIQGLEVQRGTIATLKSFGSNLGVGKTAAEPEKKSESGFSDALGNFGAGLVGAVGAIAAGQTATQAAQAAQAAGQGASLPGFAPSQPAAAAQPGATAQTAGDPAQAAADPVATALLSNASAWWNVLQDQFNKVAGAAMSGAGLTAAASETAAPATPTKSRAKRPVSAATATKPARSSAAIVKKTAAGAAKPKSRSKSGKS